MLILTRRVGETLVIGDEITVTVMGVKGKSNPAGNQRPQKRRGASRRNLRARRSRVSR
jgi:carbon storage regulator CsrA